MRHERRYLDKVKTDKLSQRQDDRMRNRKNHDIEFDDYRKSLQEEAISNKKRLKKI